MAQADYLPSSIRRPSTRGGVRPATSAVEAAHEDFIGRLTKFPPRAIPVDPCPHVLEDRAGHVTDLLTAITGYLEAILDDTAQNVPGGLDRQQIDGLLSDLASEVSGTLQKAADDLAGRAQ